MQLRAAVPDDAPAVAAMQVRAWQAGYRGLLPQHHLDALDAGERAGRYTFTLSLPEGPFTVLAVDEHASVAGQVTIGRCRDHGLGEHGEVWALYVDPSRWGSGVGSALMASAREHLMDSGFEGATLWVMEHNHRARRFYEFDGWRADGAARVDAIGETTVGEVRYRRDLG